MKPLLSNRLQYMAILVAILQTSCSQPPSDVSVAQLATEKKQKTVVDRQVETPVVPNIVDHLKESADLTEPKPHVVHKEVTEEMAAEIPKVFLSTSHSAMCRVRVGDEMPEISLSQMKGGEVSLKSLHGEQATVVLFWRPDRWMSHMALADLEREVASSAEHGTVAVVGIAVETPTEKVAKEAKAAGATFPQLVDSDATAFAKVGMVMLPRVYVLDSTGKIVWFDIEYSESTRRELKQTLAVLAGND